MERVPAPAGLFVLSYEYAVSGCYGFPPQRIQVGFAHSGSRSELYLHLAFRFCCVIDNDNLQSSFHLQIQTILLCIG